MAGSVRTPFFAALLVLATGYPSHKDGVNGGLGLLDTLQRVQRVQRAALPFDDAIPSTNQAITSHLAPFPETFLTSDDLVQNDQKDMRQRRDANATQELDSVAEATEPEMHDEEGPVADSQHFFPSFSPIFSPPLGHSRPSFYPEQSFTSRPMYKPHDSFGFGSGSFREYSFPHATAAESERSANVLGSGNFGVLRGGTYYPGDNDEVLNDDIYSNYYQGNNGHGRPSFYPANPLPSFRQGGDFFANFKDFADISTPTKSSYSEFYVVYVNPNATANSNVRLSGSAPKNIFEQLQILDAANDVPDKKVSKAKLKLDKYKTHHQTKEINKKQKLLPSPKDLYEPLLALS